MPAMEDKARRGPWVMYAWVAAVFAVVAFGWYHGSRQSGGIELAGSRKVMPSLALSQLGGGEWRMADHRGQVVLINFWATWCGPCWEETPGLVRLARELGPRGLAVVGISMDQDSRGGGRDKVQKFVDELGVAYPVAFPEPLSQIERGLEGVPTTILVDRDGRVAKSYVGAVREGDFREDVEVLLRESTDDGHAISGR